MNEEEAKTKKKNKKSKEKKKKKNERPHLFQKKTRSSMLSPIVPVSTYYHT